MRRHRLAAGLFALAALVGCQPPTAKDGYRFERAEWSNSQLRVTLVLHPSIEDLDREGRRAGAIVQRDEGIAAWSLIDAHGNCTIHIVDPTRLYLPEFIGHELAHCAFGRFHGARS
ncbi:hypothetical protein [Sphingomonas fennica]|uniref:Uncharacterized protein n=1 Tax=Edaphosphingomonas fennica TaxID=114404 RepID=A0A2T4HVQ5_9SPHN|nr:hypothetical protein [Sphingomonas fennica]PTD19886.1 hypothetical protein CV103_11905 [Sphingomonas fennica]